jgi:hypothetical protein
MVSFRTLMGLISKGAKCNVSGCDNDGIRSLTASKVEGTGLNVPPGSKKTILCKEHYKEWKKATKDDRDTERARFDRF